MRRFSLLVVRVAAALTVGIFAMNLLLHRPILDALLFSLVIAVGISPAAWRDRRGSNLIRMSRAEGRGDLGEVARPARMNAVNLVASAVLGLFRRRR